MSKLSSKCLKIKGLLLYLVGNEKMVVSCY